MTARASSPSAAAGLVDGRGSPLLLSVELDQKQFDEVTGPGTRYIVTDSNRKRAERWYALRENFGATEPANEPAITYQDPSDARLEVVPDAPSATYSVAEWRGAERVWASSYGNEFTLLPETRPVNAFDGDPRTAWLIEPKGPAGADPTVGIRLDQPSTADHVTLVQPTIKPGTIATTKARVVLDGDPHLRRRHQPRAGALARPACACRSTASRSASSRCTSSRRSRSRGSPGSPRSRSRACRSRR